MINSIVYTVSIMLGYMMIGFIMCKCRKTEVFHAKSLSAILIFVLGPAMIFLLV